MENTIELGISEMFRDATMQSVVPELRTKGDWEQFNKIKDTAEKLRTEEIQRFERDQPELLTAARQQLLKKAGALKLDHPTPVGVDKFDPDALERRAVEKINADHQGRLLRMTAEETEKFGNLHQEITSREDARGQAQESFNRNRDQPQEAFRRAAGPGAPTRQR